MRNATLLALAILLATTGAMADNRTMTEMRDIAAAKLTRTAAVKGQWSQVRPATLQCAAEDDAYAVFIPAEDAAGFVIVARSNLVEPVIGYSTERFDADDMPDGLRWFLAAVSRRLAAAEAGFAGAPRRTAAAFTPVDNFVTTQWSQDYPFDRKTPNNYPAGCIATALAQCLNYCQYPPSADFTGSYSITTTKGKKETTEQKTEHVSTTYTWPYKDTYKSRGSYGDNIDELLRDCGYATYMEYTKDGSGSNCIYAALALTGEFGYPEECIKYHSQEIFNGDQEAWNQIIYDELAARSPVLYGAKDPAVGGHAFVFTGVDADGLVYVNWGWRGTADGFYDIQLLDPTAVGSQDHYTESHQMVTGIRTTPLATDGIQTRIWGYSGDPYTFRWGTEENEDGTSFHTLYADLPYGFLNMSPSGFQGVFGLFAQDLTDGTAWVIAEDLQDRDTIPSGYGYCGSSEQYKEFYFYYDISGEQGLKPGHTYRMAFGTKDDREGTWHSILIQGQEIAYDITYTGDPATSTVDPEIKEMPVLTAVHAPLAAPAGSHQLPLYFDLSGRRIQQPAHGLFIQGGRKVLR